MASRGGALTSLWVITNLVAVAVMVGVSWTIIYYLSYLPLMESGGLGHWLSLLSHVKLSDTFWWREFLAGGFDLLIIIVGVIGSWWTLGHFAAELKHFRKWKRYYKERGKLDVWVKRIGLWERIQHIWMMVTFIICAFTGFVMYLSNNPYWRALMTSREAYVKLHVISGIAMTVLVGLHFGYYTVQAILAKMKGRNVLEEFPILRFYTLSFYKALVKRLLWTLTARVRPEKVHKYNCEQLFEYWGVYWGIAVLGIPGVIMTIAGPQALNGVLWVMHTKEAVLAVTFILLVHMSYTHLRPSIFPYDPVFIKGKMPAAQIKEEHPLWYESLVKSGVLRESEPSKGGERKEAG
ncbi:MAG: hydrogenase cytochrome b subunit [Hyperthermus sp.]|nr:MAG: hydrogenase cytochrome b subunit [Hyperthermus sp.]